MTHRIYAMAFASIHRAYLNKVERKGRSRDELDRVLCWLTGHSEASLAGVLAGGVTVEAFFAGAPALNPARALVTGSVCGVKVQEVAEPLMREIRICDKLVDELAKGRPLDKVLRG
jgi:hypothetical protein